MNILLDFDGTCSGGHSKGRVFNESVPMDKENQILFINSVNTWLNAGNNVAIITRGIGTKIGPYFTNILGIPFVSDNWQQGMVSIFAPDEDTFNSHPDADFWADEKLLYVKRFLDCSNSLSKNTIFMDDTLINVTEMHLEFPDMLCVHVKKFGDYRFTFQTVNDVLTNSATINYT
jgi:hypothetical protein